MLQDSKDSKGSRMKKPISPGDCGWPDSPTQALGLSKSDKLQAYKLILAHLPPNLVNDSGDDCKPSPATRRRLFHSSAICGIWGTVRLLSLNSSHYTM